MERPETDPHKYSQLIFDKGEEMTEQRQSLQQMVLEYLETHMEKKNLGSEFTPFIQITQNGSKWT